MDINGPNQDKLKMKTINTYLIDIENGTKTVIDSRQVRSSTERQTL